ncbi:MAG TPA: hypothetical protein VK053_00090 [Jiangellaceae bacterium]|nr:hypothetical protein [Jiangellaceae bacterium]
MSTLNAVARRVRAVPGYPVVRRRAIRTVRRSPTARQIVKRVFDIDDGGDGWAPPTDVAAGRVLGGVGTEALPVVLVVMLEPEPDIIGPTLEQIAQLQLMGAGFRPVVLSDVPLFPATRPFGYPVELVPAERTWRPEQDGPWEDHVRARISLALDTYRCTCMVNIGPNGLDRTGRLLLTSLRAKRARASTRTAKSSSGAS